MKFNTIGLKYLKRVPDLAWISLIYWLTRLPFLQLRPVYYDSFEYVHLVERGTWGNWISLIQASHQPVHTWYLATALLVRLMTGFSATTTLALLSILSGWGVVLVWYSLIHRFKTQTNIALWSSIFLLAFPTFFLSNVNILYESFLLLWQLGALFLFDSALRRSDWQRMALAGVFFGVAQTIFVGNLFFVAVFIAWWLAKAKLRKIPQLLIFFAAFLFSTLFVELLVGGTSTFLLQKYLGHIGDVPPAAAGPFLWLARVARNIMIQSWWHLTSLGAVLFGYGLWQQRTWLRTRTSWWLWGWLLSSLVLMQYWHAGFFGRLSLGIIFPVSFVLAASMASRLSRAVVIGVLSWSLIGWAWQVHAPLPLQILTDQTLSVANTKNIAVITSDAARFFYQEKGAPFLSLRGVPSEKSELDAFVKQQSFFGRKIVVDQQAWRVPYYQLDGWEYQPLSLRSSPPLVVPNWLPTSAPIELQRSDTSLSPWRHDLGWQFVQGFTWFQPRKFSRRV